MRLFFNSFFFALFATNLMATIVPYTKYSGYVTHGDKLGDLINLKGANLYVQNLQEKTGIYACRVDLPNLNIINTKALCWIEENPSNIIEAHILDFNEDIYTQPIIITLIKFIRTPKNFKTLEKCLTAIENDKNTVRNLLN